MSRTSDRAGFPALKHLLLILPWIMIGRAARAPLRDNSFLWHVRAGTLQIDQGGALAADPFSFTSPPGAVWRTQSWLAELLYGWLERRTSLGFVWPMVAVGGLLAVAALALSARRWTRSVTWMAVFLTISTIVFSAYLNPRPALFSLVLMTVIVLICLQERLWWTLPLIVWLWASLHGAWPLGVAFVALFAISRRQWRLGWQVVPMSVAALFTAHGWGVLEILVDFVRSRKALSLITEWAPTNLASLAGFVFLVALLALIIPAARGQVTANALWVLVPFSYLAVSSTRSLPIGWIALTPFLARITEGREDPRLFGFATRSQGRLNVVLGAAMALLPFFVARNTGIDPEHFPVEAATHLTSDRVFHDDTTGGYLIYARWPDRQIYIDDRAELYGEGVGNFIKARNADPIWEDIFNQYGIGEALLRKTDPLVSLLDGERWRTRFEDETFVVMSAP